jgi:hypothetical protein
VFLVVASYAGFNSSPNWADVREALEAWGEHGLPGGKNNAHMNPSTDSHRRINETSAVEKSVGNGGECEHSRVPAFFAH